jgi:hypothetical protein
MEETTNKQANQETKGAPIILIILSAFSFIPLIGVFFGGLSILISIFNFKRFKLLFFLGCSGILLTIILYSSVYYIGVKQRGGVADYSRVEMDGYLLKYLKESLIKYKSMYGNYPSNLNELKKSGIQIKDPILYFIKGYKGDSLFYYQVKADTFQLFSVGIDGLPFTKDDVYPRPK